jgi:RHS repeat-associated protein
VDLWGALSEATGVHADCTIGWPGQYVDQETGLRYNRFRYYDPKLAVYISQDPLRLAGGHVLYGYSEDPLFGSDPFGLVDILRTGGPIDVDAYPGPAVGGPEHAPLHFHMREQEHETRVLVEDYYKKGRLVARAGQVYPGDKPLTKRMRKVIAEHFSTFAARARAVFNTGQCE